MRLITSWLKIDRTFTAATATTAVFCALLASGGAVQSAVKRQANARSTIASEVNSPDGTLVDGEFLNWSFNSVGGGGSAAREDSGGNPGARLRISTSAPVGTNTVTAIKDDYTTNFPFEGDTFTFSVDFLSGAGAHDDGQALLLLVQQGSDIYGLPLGITRVQTDWTTLVRNGTFNQAAFSHILGPGAPMPDFSSGAPTKFGFAGQNSDSSITNYYDNFHLVSNAIPALSAARHRVDGINTVLLTWSGATSADIDVYRDSVLITTTPNDGNYDDSTGDTGQARYKYRVCEAGTSSCSNVTKVTFPP